MRKYGIIKSTFAELYDADGKKLFSVQKADAVNAEIVDTTELNTPDEYVRVHLTDLGMELLSNKLKGSVEGSEQLQEILYVNNHNELFVQKGAFEWKSAVKGWLIAGALVAGGLLLLNRKKH